MTSYYSLTLVSLYKLRKEKNIAKLKDIEAADDTTALYTSLRLNLLTLFRPSPPRNNTFEGLPKQVYDV